LRITFRDETTGEQDSWQFVDDLRTYLIEQLGQFERLPTEPITGGYHADGAVIDYALTWTLQGHGPIRESYVDLVPTPRDFTRADGLSAGVTRAVRQFGDTYDFVPPCTQLASEDVWESFVVSARSQGPSFRRFWGSRIGEMAPMEAFVGDSVSRWLNLHPDAARRIVRIALAAAQARTGDDR
jgi:topoisomerase-4 subunit B